MPTFNLYDAMDLSNDFGATISNGVDAIHGFQRGVEGLIETIAPNAAGGSSTTFSPAEASNNKKRKRLTGSNNLFTQTGASILAQSGKTRLPRTVMKFNGHREYPDCITPFLKHLAGSGVVANEWTGIMRSARNIRTSFLTFFRHNVSYYTGTGVTAGFVKSGPYDTDVVPNVLLPANATAIGIADTSGSVSGSTYVHADQQCYFAPLNRADYEDMSWNLNRLKLIQAAAASTYSDTGISFAAQGWWNVGLLGVDEHRRIGQMHQSNALPPTNRTESPYRYNMVFNYGTAEYVFSNKGIFAADVEIVLYRIKKNSSVAACSSTATGGTESTVSLTLPYAQLADPIGDGYVKSVKDKYGTDNLGGRLPAASDIAINPRVALMPKTKPTMQSNLPYAEVVRKKFTIPCGARKPITLNFPGVVYDPTSIKSTVGYGLVPSSTTGLRSPEFYAQLDDHTYAVLIAVNGVIQTTNYHKDPHIQPGVSAPTPAPPISVGAVDVPFLDCYGPSDVQYYCTYSEHIGACQYKTPATKRVYVNGAAKYPVFSGDGDVHEEAICMIPAEQVMRTPRKVTTTQSVDTNWSNTAQTGTTSSGVHMSNAGPLGGAGD